MWYIRETTVPVAGKDITLTRYDGLLRNGETGQSYTVESERDAKALAIILNGYEALIEELEAARES